MLAAALVAQGMAFVVDWPSPPRLAGWGLAVLGATAAAVGLAAFTTTTFFRRGLLLFGQAALEVTSTLCVMRLQWNKCKGACSFHPFEVVLAVAPASAAGNGQHSCQPLALWMPRSQTLSCPVHLPLLARRCVAGRAVEASL